MCVCVCVWVGGQVCVGVGVDEYFKCVLDSVHICVMRVDVCVLYRAHLSL